LSHSSDAIARIGSSKNFNAKLKRESSQNGPSNIGLRPAPPVFLRLVSALA
jgi:hypothetical protein